MNSTLSCRAGGFRTRSRCSAAATIVAVSLAVVGETLGERGAHAHASAVPAAPLPEAGGEFADDWYFDGADRPRDLRALEGTAAPEIDASEWIGDASTIESLRGKVIVVDFWATWCGPCMAAIPKNVELVKSKADAGLVMIGLHDGSSGWDKAAGVVRDKGINYPVAKDRGDTVKRFKLSFWPTYVVIDRAGVIRAAGLLPDKVGPVVEKLLAEAPPPGLGGAPTGHPAEWYVGGAARPKWLATAETKPSPKIPLADGADGAEDADAAERWFGTPLAPEAVKDRVVVLFFLSGESELALKEGVAISEFAETYRPQGVTVVGVCDARSDWAAAKTRFAERGFTFPIVQDARTAAAQTPAAGGAVAPAGAGAPQGAGAAGMDIEMMQELEVLMAEDGEMVFAPGAVPGAAVDPTGVVGGAVPAPGTPAARGALAESLGIRLAPVTVILGRDGKIFAAGIRRDKLGAAVGKALSTSG